MMLNLKTFGGFLIYFRRSQILTKFFSGFLLLIKLTVGLYDSSDDVVQLTSANFDRLVTSSDNVWIVEFFAPWCKICCKCATFRNLIRFLRFFM